MAFRNGLLFLEQFDFGKSEEATVVGCAFGHGEQQRECAISNRLRRAPCFPHFVNIGSRAHSGSDVNVGKRREIGGGAGERELRSHVELTQFVVTVGLIGAAGVQRMNVKS